MTRSLVLASFTALALAPSALAAPSTKDPHSPLPVRAEPESETLAAEAESILREIAPQLKQLHDYQANVNAADIEPLAFGTIHRALVQLARVSKRLVERGEPAGVYYELRMRAVQVDLDAGMNSYRKVPGVQQRLADAHTPFLNEAAKNARTADPQVKRLAKQGNWVEAERVLYRATDPLEEPAAWYFGENRERAFRAFIPAQQSIIPAAQELRMKEVESTLTQVRAEQTPDLVSLYEAFRSAISEVAKSGVCQFEEKSLGGPELVTEYAKRWQAAQVSVIHCLGLDWSRGLRAGAPDSAALNELLVGYTGFCQESQSGLLALIEAEIRRSSAAEARALYIAYLEALAPLLALNGDEAFRRTIESKLVGLVEKSPALMKEVNAYESATAELLRWRRRAAAAAVTGEQAHFQASADAVSQAVRIEGVKPGLAPSAGYDWGLTFDAPKVMERLQEELVGKPITIESVVGLPTSKPVSASRYACRHYATFTRPDSVGPHVAALAADLLATEATPPMTLTAAIALATARRGDFAAVGGTVEGATLEAVLTRFTMLPASAGVLLPLRELAEEPLGDSPIIQALLRVELKPAWFSHEYFFVAAPQ